MMNGAAMNCRQDQVLHSLHRDSRGLQSAGYHLQMNNPCEQNFPAQHSKTITSQSDHFVIDDSSQYFQSMPTIESFMPARSEVHDPRSQVRWAEPRKPIDLPVPHFDIDVNFVGNHLIGSDDSYHNQNNLDLDTRIDLLIKSKALAGMHPIFSELDESTDDSDDSLIKGPKPKKGKKHRSPSPVDQFLLDNCDDPDKPLSRPPSPFLSRAKYLFWFNKAIELKEQAKVQEQELIEKATKKLLHDNVATLNSSSLNLINPNHIKKSNKDNKPLLNGLLDEITKEIKEMIKQQCIDDVLESTISNTLDSWWEKEKVNDEQQHSQIGCQKINSTFQEQSKKISQNSFKLEDTEKVVPEHEERLYVNDNGCNKTTYSNSGSEKSVREPPEKYTNTDKSSYVDSHTASNIINVGSLLRSENKNNKDKHSEENIERPPNIKATKHIPIIDIQELLSNIENSLDNLSKSGVASKISEESLKTGYSTNTKMNCQKKQVSIEKEGIEEKSSDCKDLSDVIISENLSTIIPAQRDADMHLTKHSDCESPLIVHNKQILSHDSSQECEQNAIETSLLPKYDETLQILVKTSSGSEGLKGKSENFEQTTTNTSIMEEGENTSEKRLINTHAQQSSKMTSNTSTK